MTISAATRPSFALAQERLELSERLLRCSLEAPTSDVRTRAAALHRRAYLSHLDRYLAWTRHATPAERLAEMRAWKHKELSQ